MSQPKMTTFGSALTGNQQFLPREKDGSFGTVRSKVARSGNLAAQWNNNIVRRHARTSNMEWKDRSSKCVAWKAAKAEFQRTSERLL